MDIKGCNTIVLRNVEQQATTYVPIGLLLIWSRDKGFHCSCKLRAILNFTPGPQGIISPLGVNLAPRGEFSPLGVKFTPSFIPRGEHSSLFRRMEGRTENFTHRG
jgi:hypothetical protein